MERKLKQKTFSDVLEEAIKQRWGAKRKTPSVNFPRSAKKGKVQPLGYSTSQQDNKGTSVADHESFSQSQPIISEKQLSSSAKQTIRGWKPPLKRYQEIIGRNAMDMNSITSLKLPKNNSQLSGYTDADNFEKNGSKVNSVHCEATNVSENVPPNKHTAHKLHSTLTNRMEGTRHENKESLEGTSLILKDNAGSIYEDFAQTSCIQQCKSQCSPADTFAHANTSGCVQSSTLDKETEMGNPTLLNQASNDSKEYKLAISSIKNNNNGTLIEGIANSEELLSNTITETDLKIDDMLCLSQQTTQPYVLTGNATHAEKAIVIEEEIENPSDSCEAMLLSPKASQLANGIHNETINASHTISDAVNEGTTKDSTLYSGEFIPSENTTTAKEVNLSPMEEMQHTSDSKGSKEFLKYESSESIIFKSVMAKNKQNWLASEQNDDKCNSIDLRKSCTNRENVTCKDDQVSDEATVITKTTNSVEEENNNKYEKGICLEIESRSAKTIQPQSCDEISTHNGGGVNASTDKFSEKMFVFDAKKFTKAEAKFQNVFHFEKFAEETPDKDNIFAFDKKKPPKQHTQMKTSESHNACMAPVVLNEDSSAGQKSEDAGFLDEMKTNESKNDMVVGAADSKESSDLERTCKSTECELKWTKHTAKESFNREMTKADSSAFVLPVGATDLQMNQSILKFNDEDQNVKSPNNTKPFIVKENVELPATERRNNLIVPNGIEPMTELSNTEDKTPKYQQTQEVISASSQSIVNNDGNIQSEDKYKNKLIAFKDKVTSQSNGNSFVFERETLTENSPEEKTVNNITLESKSVSKMFASQTSIFNLEAPYALGKERASKESKNANDENKFASQSIIINSETSQAVEERACITELLKENLVENSSSTEIEKYVDEIKTNHSKNDRQDRPEDVIYTGCCNSSTKKVKPQSADFKDQISVPDIDVRNGCEAQNKSNTEQYPLINKTEKETENLKLTDNKESAYISFQNYKQPENKFNVLIADTANNDKITLKNSNTDFSEMEDDFGLTVSQILRIEDECQQKMFMPEMSPIQWAQKVRESRRKVQAVVQEITMLNAMLKKARKEVWQPQSNADTAEGTSTEDFNTLPRPTSYRWNRDLNSRPRQNMQRK